MISKSLASLNPFLVIKEIKDQYLRKNFQNLSDYFSKQNQLLDFTFLEVNFSQAQTSAKLAHNLGYAPSDVVVSWFSGPGDLTFDLASSDSTSLVVSCTDAVKARFYVGRYWQSNPLSSPGSMTLSSTDATSSPNSLPSGMVTAFAGTKVPAGWLLCDGTSYAQSQYPDLYAAIGIAHGKLSDTTFCVPDYRGRFLRCINGTSTLDPDAATRTAMNSNGNTGNAIGSVQTDAFQGHRHAVIQEAGSAPAGVPVNSSSLFGANATTPVNTKAIRDPITDGVNGTPKTALETRPQNAYVNYIIKT